MAQLKKRSYYCIGN